MKYQNTSDNHQLYLATENQLKSLVLQCVREALEETSSQSRLDQGGANRELIDTKELLLRLGLSEPTVIRYRQKGVIPFYRIGNAIRYDYEKVLERLEKKKGRR